MRAKIGFGVFPIEFDGIHFVDESQLLQQVDAACSFARTIGFGIDADRAPAFSAEQVATISSSQVPSESASTCFPRTVGFGIDADRAPAFSTSTCFPRTIGFGIDADRAPAFSASTCFPRTVGFGIDSHLSPAF